MAYLNVVFKRISMCLNINTLERNFLLFKLYLVYVCSIKSIFLKGISNDFLS